MLPRTIPLLVATIALVTLGEMVAMPVAGAYVADLAPAHQRGLYMGTYGLVGALAFVCGPSLGMLLFSANPVVLWSACGVLGLVAARIIWRERENGRDRSTAAEPEPAGESRQTATVR